MANHYYTENPELAHDLESNDKVQIVDAPDLSVYDR